MFVIIAQGLTTARMEFEALEDEAHAIHGDLWEQLNAGGQVRSGLLCRYNGVGVYCRQHFFFKSTKQ